MTLSQFSTRFLKEKKFKRQKEKHRSIKSSLPKKDNKKDKSKRKALLSLLERPCLIVEERSDSFVCLSRISMAHLNIFLR